MKRTNLFIVLFLVLGLATFFLLKDKEETTSTVLGLDRDFKVENTEDIHKVFIAKRTGQTTTLERKGKGWVYNGKYKARPDAMENLLDAVSTVRMKYVPPNAAIDNIVKDLATNGIKVEIYGKNNEKIKAYYVGGTTADERGTHMIMEGAENPYIVELPLMEGGIRVRYDLPELAWRDRAVFQKDVEDIKSVSIEYPKQMNKSFRLERKGNDYSVEPFYEITQSINRPKTKGMGERFLINFNKIIAEGFENDSPQKDSITQTIPFCTITLEDTDGETRAVTLYPKASTDAYGQVQTGEIERYWAEVSNGDFLMVQHRVIERILWAYEFFFD